MKLVQLELENFRQHRRTSLSFGDGITGIIGPNGAGKTTIVEAIAFALYGTRALRGKLDEACTRGAPKDAEPSVTLVFEHEGQTLRIERVGSSASVYQGGSSSPIATGSREVASVVASSVGMSLEEFFATYFTEQKGLEFLSGQKGATEREKFILRLMGYDRFEKVQELLRAERKEKKGTLSGWEAGLGSKEQLEAQLAQEQEAVVSLEASLKEAALALTQAEVQYEKARLHFSQSEAKHKEWRALSRLLQEKQTRHEERTRALGDIQAQRKELSSALEAKWRAWGTERVEDLKALLDERSADLTACQEEVKRAREKKEAAERAWIEQRTAEEAAFRVAEAQHKERSERLKELSSLQKKGECPTCGQELGSRFADVLEKEEQVLVSIRLRVDDSKASAKAANQEPEVLVSLRKSIAEREHTLEALRASLRDLDAAMRQAHELERQIAAEQKAHLEIAELAEAVRTHAKQLEELVYSEEIYSRDKGAFDAAQSLTNVARLQRVRVEGDLGTRQALVARTKTQLIEYDARVRELDKMREELLTLEETDTFLTEFRRHVNSSIRPRLAEIASEFISDLTDGRYTTIEVATDFAPTVIDEGEAKPVISGGEEDILNLCMRLALSQMLAERAGHSFSLLILDEVFGSLDEQRRTNVLTLLEKLSNRFEQILIITHLDDVKEGVRNLVYIDFDEASGQVALANPQEEALEASEAAVVNF